jgi:hypothetical protein
VAHRQPLEDIVFISNFAAFCRTKGDEAYRYIEPMECGLAQFLQTTGRWDSPALPCGLSKSLRDQPVDWWNAPLFSDLNSALMVGRFDLLADRLEALIVDSPVVQVQA